MRARHSIVYGVAFASGAAALLYQVVWMRWFQVLFGSTAYAASATLCAFFAGLAIGSEFFGRRSSTLRRPLLAYAVIESVAALLALAVPLAFWANDALYPLLYRHLAQAPFLFVVVKFTLAISVMLPPAILLGGSFPLLATARVSDVASLGRIGARLYAINTLGAAAGCAAGALWLPDQVGVQATYAIAIGLSLLAATVALALERGSAPVAFSTETVEVEQRQPVDSLRPATASGVLRWVSFASGFGTLALEVLLIHAIAQRLDHSVYSYGAVLVVVLLCLAVGAHLVSISAKWFEAETLLGVALLAAAALLAVLPAAIERYDVVQDAGGLLRGLDAAFWLGGPALLVGSLILPLLFRLTGSEEGGVGRQVGGLLAVNTFGGILGSLAGSFLLLEAFGLAPSIAIVGLGYGAVAVFSAGNTRSRMLRAAVLVVLYLGVMSSALDPWSLPRVVLEPGDRLVDLREGPYGVVSVIDNAGGRVMKINNHYTLSGSGPRDPLKERSGHIPMLLHPQPQRVLFVGSATGHTAGSAVLHPLREIVLVEIVPEVQELAAEHFAASNRGVYQDPRTRRIVEDGRNHLRATDETYDVIVGDLFSPWRPGVGALYAREHFEAVRARLAPDGVFCQWLPLYQHSEQTFATVAATFLQVFPEAQVFRGDFYQALPRVALIGFAGRPQSVARVNERVLELGRLGVNDRWVTRPRAFWMLYAGPLAALSGRLLETAENSDAHPRFEYLAGRTTRSQIREFLFETWPAWNRTLLAEVAEDGDFGDAFRAARDGADLLHLNALERSSNRVDFEAEIEALRQRLPANLLAVPDPSALEMQPAS